MADCLDDIPYEVGTFLKSVKTQTHSTLVYLYNDMHMLQQMQLVHNQNPNQLCLQVSQYSLLDIGNL